MYTSVKQKSFGDSFKSQSKFKSKWLETNIVHCVYALEEEKIYRAEENISVFFFTLVYSVKTTKSVNLIYD